MRKLITSFTLGLLLTGSTVSASPVDFKSGSLDLEFGSTLNAKVTGKGHINTEVSGKSGFKAAITAGLNDRIAFQYRHGQFKSEDGTMLGITTYAQAQLHDVNLLYKLNPSWTVIAGYEHNEISYGMAVSDASHSTMHLGLSSTQRINDRIALFGTLIGGNHVSMQEIGIRYQLSPRTDLNISYADRRVNNVDLKVPAHAISDKENYIMTGVTFVLASRF